MKTINLILFLAFAHSCLASGTFFCSTICAAVNCNGTTQLDCTNCATGWITNATTCSVDPASGLTLIQETSDLSGSNILQITSPTTTATCDTYTYYGNLINTDQAVITLSSGVGLNHFSVTLQFWLILIDGFDWTSTSIITVSMVGTLTTANLIIPVTTYDAALNLCGSGSSEQTFKRVSQTWQHQNGTSTSITFNINTNESSTNYWGIKEAILLAKLCDSSCLACYNNLSSTCYTCASGYLLSGSSCSLACLANYGFLNSTACILCDTSCSSCYSLALNCSACKTGFYLQTVNSTYSTCVSTCNTGQFANNSTKTCDSCNTNCSSCTTTANNCLTCISTFGLVNATCYNPCPTGYWMNGSLCSLCSVYCVTCSNSSTNCSSCTTSGANIAYLSGNSCVQTCTGSTFANSVTQACDPCDSNCLTCSSNSTHCLTCNTGWAILNSVCYNPCPTGYWMNGTICSNCSVFCISCTTSSTTCTACTLTGANKAYLMSSNSSCLVSCPASGYFTTTSPNVCNSCDPSCSQCTGSLNSQCSSCTTGNMLSGTTCSSSCLPAYGITSNVSLCVLCDTKCIICSMISTNCSSCQTSGPDIAFLYNSTCVVTCPAKYFANTTTQACDPCTTNCSTCVTNSTNCLSCISTYGFLSNVCYNPCPDTYYLNGSNCSSCNQYCLHCTASPTNCTSCILTGANQAFLLSSTCYPICPNPYYGNSNGGAGPNICSFCNSKCTSCTGPNITQCNSCVTNYTLSGTTCATSCATGYGKTLNSSLCILCDVDCLVCFQVSNNCSSCIPAQFVLPVNASFSQCVTSCPVSYFPNMTSHYCIACPSGCYECLNSTYCYSCIAPNMYVVNTSATPTGYLCFNPCPINFYQKNSTNCSQCALECAVCVNMDPQNCTSCMPYGAGLAYLLGSVCYPNCPGGYYGSKNPNICLPCNAICLSCNGPNANNCLICSGLLYLNGGSCLANCTTGYGITSTPYICVQCSGYCNDCSYLATNCTSCKTSGSNQAFLYTFGAYPTCYANCPAGYFNNKTTHLCDKCDSVCKTCINSSTTCLECVVATPAISWMNYTCAVCPISMYYVALNNTVTHNITVSGVNKTVYGTNCTPTCKNCSNCHPACLHCTAAVNTSCSACATSGSYKSYLYNTTCMKNCPVGYYKATINGSNICDQCDPSCQACTGSPTPCSSCSSGYYLYQNQCNQTCPTGYFPYNATRVCLSNAANSVNLTISMFFGCPNFGCVMIDMYFDAGIDYAHFNMTQFQTITFQQNNSTELISNLSISMFTISYAILNSNLYRITITPNQYMFMYNAIWSVQTGPTPQTLDVATNGKQFAVQNYNMSSSISWTLMNGPTPLPSIIPNLASFTSWMNNFTTQPYAQQLKKTGVLGLLFSGSQITTTLILSNTIPSQPAYQAARFWSSFVLYDTPNWQLNSTSDKVIIAPSLNASNLLPGWRRLFENQGNRLLFDASQIFWRFRRTGFTTFFIYDCYVQMFMIALCWILLLIGEKCIANKDSTCLRILHKRAPVHLSRIYTLFHKVHQICIYYFTIGMVLELLFFDFSAQRYLSLTFCLLFNIYYILYQLKIYYDIIRYPWAAIGTPLFQTYVIRYGSLLKNLRYVEYDVFSKQYPQINSKWTPKHWLRPYNYHILSYYKKFLMMMSLPLFYGIAHAQMSVLIIIQTFQLIRFILTWPYRFLWRNILRLVLESLLLVFFVLCLIQQLLVSTVLENDANTIQSSMASFQGLGWITFILIMIYNVAFVILFVYDLYIGCKKSNSTLIREVRKEHYTNLLQDYENSNNGEITKFKLDQWVKLGGLLDDDEDSSDSDRSLSKGKKSETKKKRNFKKITLEQVIIKKIDTYFEIKVKKAHHVKTNDQGKTDQEIKKERRNDKLQFKLRNTQMHAPHHFLNTYTITPNTPRIYNALHSLFLAFDYKQTAKHLTVKTTASFDPSLNRPGFSIPVDEMQLSHKVILEKEDGSTEVKKLSYLLDGFPLDLGMIR